MKKNRLIYCLTVLFILPFFTKSTSAANEQSAPYIGVTPVRNEMILQPGENYTGSFQVSNVGDSGFKYSISASPYQVTGTNYGSDFLTENTYTMLANWITIETDSGYLEPHSVSAPIKYTISVPDDVPAGGQYAAIKATAINEKTLTDSGVNFQTSAAILVYASIEGETRKEGSVIENNIPSFLLTTPLNTTFLIENTGNIHDIAEYYLQVFPLFSDEEVYTNEEDPGKSTILPETRRLLTQTWDKTPPVGIFKVRQTVKIFDETSINEKIVVICPLWLICVVIFAIIAAIIYLVAKSKARKKSTK